MTKETDDWRKILKPDTKDNGVIHPKNKLNNLTGKEWIPLTKSFWMQSGLGANHPDAQIEKEHPAPYSFSDIKKLILFFTKAGDIVLDPFSGVASTAKACAIAERKSVGIELTKKWVDLSLERLKKEVGSLDGQKIIRGDSRKVLKDFNDEYFDFLVTSPPYWQILNKKTDLKTRPRVQSGLSKKYSEDKDDLGNIENYQDFLTELQAVFKECHRVLKNNKYAAVVVSDFRNKDKFIPYHMDVINILEKINYGLKGIIILIQNHKSLHPYGYPYAYVPNIHHQYILIFRKEENEKRNKK